MLHIAVHSLHPLWGQLLFEFPLALFSFVAQGKLTVTFSRPSDSFSCVCASYFIHYILISMKHEIKGRTVGFCTDIEECNKTEVQNLVTPMQFWFKAFPKLFMKDYHYAEWKSAWNAKLFFFLFFFVLLLLVGWLVGWLAVTAIVSNCTLSILCTFVLFQARAECKNNEGRKHTHTHTHTHACTHSRTHACMHTQAHIQCMPAYQLQKQKNCVCVSLSVCLSGSKLVIAHMCIHTLECTHACTHMDRWADSVAKRLILLWSCINEHECDKLQLQHRFRTLVILSTQWSTPW